jgi:hypothetical protein
MIQEQKTYLGVDSLRKAQEIPKAKAAFALNMNLGSSSSLVPAKGYSTFGNVISANLTGSKITTKYTYERGSGYETQLRVRDDASNTIVEYLNPGDIRNNSNGEWLSLLTGQTKDVVYGFAPFNDTGVDKLLWCDAIDNFRSWTGAICLADGAITLGLAIIPVKKVTGDPKTNATDGFPATGSFTYRDTAGVFITVTYTGKSNTTFTGCVGATVSATNTGIANITINEIGIPKNNILITAQGRVWAAGRTDAPNQVQCSKVSDYTNWTAGTTPDAAALEDFPDGGNVTALVAKDDWIFIGKKRRVIALKYTITSISDGAGGAVQTKSRVDKIVARIGMVSQKATALIGDDIYFISSKGQIRRLFGLEAENEFRTENINREIQPSLVKSVFTDASMEYFQEQNLLIVAFMKNSDSSVNDYGEFIWFSINELGQTNINISFHDWFIGDTNIYNDKLYFGSSIDGADYKAFDGYTKDGAPYDTKYVTRIEDGAEVGFNTFIEKFLEYLFVKGAIGAGTIINLKLYYDDNGSTGILPLTMDYNDGEPYIIQQTLNTLNSFALNTEPLGGVLTELSELNPFKYFFPLPTQYEPYNWQLEISTSGTGQIYEIDTHGYNIMSVKSKQPNSTFFKQLG